MINQRYVFINHAENISKFWQIEQNERVVAVAYGRIGQKPRIQTQHYETHTEAVKEAHKRIASKLRKGYLLDEDSSNDTKVDEKPDTLFWRLSQLTQDEQEAVTCCIDHLVDKNVITRVGHELFLDNYTIMFGEIGERKLNTIDPLSFSGAGEITVDHSPLAIVVMATLQQYIAERFGEDNLAIIFTDKNTKAVVMKKWSQVKEIILKIHNTIDDAEIEALKQKAIDSGFICTNHIVLTSSSIRPAFF